MAEVKERNVQTHGTHPQLVGDALELKAADGNKQTFRALHGV